MDTSFNLVLLSLRPNGRIRPRMLTIISNQLLMVMSSPPKRTSLILRPTLVTIGSSMMSNLSLMSSLMLNPIQSAPQLDALSTSTRLRDLDMISTIQFQTSEEITSSTRTLIAWTGLRNLLDTIGSGLKISLKTLLFTTLPSQWTQILSLL